MTTTNLLATGWKFLRAEELSLRPAPPALGGASALAAAGLGAKASVDDLDRLERKLELELGLTFDSNASMNSLLGPEPPAQTPGGAVSPSSKVSGLFATSGSGSDGPDGGPGGQQRPSLRREGSLHRAAMEGGASFDGAAGMPDTAAAIERDGGVDGGTNASRVSFSPDEDGDDADAPPVTSRRKSRRKSDRAGAGLERKLSELRRRASVLPRSLMELEMAKAEEEAATIEQASREHGSGMELESPKLRTRSSIVPAGLDEAVETMDEAGGVPADEGKATNKSYLAQDADDACMEGDRHAGKLPERSQGPTIMWRPSTRVKLATDVPEELLAMLADDSGADTDPFMLASPGPEGTPPAVTTRPATISAMRRQREAKARAERAAFMSLRTDTMHAPLEVVDSVGDHGLDSSFGGGEGGSNGDRDASMASTARARARPPRYGAWYLPPKHWQVQPRGRGAAGGADGADGDRAGLVASFEQRIPNISNLYSAQLYREYVRTLGHKLPHYLQVPNHMERERARRK